MAGDHFHRRRAFVLGGLAAGGLAAGGWPPSALAASVATPAADRGRTLEIVTDDSNSAYYAVGVGYSALAKMRLPPDMGLDVYTRTSLGSWENAVLLRRRRADLAIMQAIYGHWARTGTGVFRRQGADPGLRAIASLWPDAEHAIVSLRHASSGTIEDLRNLDGAPFVVGPRGSGTEGSTHLILRRLGIDPARAMRPVNLGPAEAASSLLMGSVAGLTLPGGPPISLVDAILSHDVSNVKVLEFTDRQMALINGETNVWRRYNIVPGTYLGQEQPIMTIAQPAFLAVRADLDSRLIERMTHILFEDLAILRAAHRTAAAISLETAFDGLPVPLHDGAIRYYQSVGMDIPPHLIP